MFVGHRGGGGALKLVKNQTIGYKLAVTLSSGKGLFQSTLCYSGNIGIALWSRQSGGLQSLRPDV